MNRNDIVVVYCEVMKDGERPLKLLKLARSQQPVAAMPAVAMRFHCQICPPLGQPDCKQCECGEQWRVRRAKTCAKLLRATLSSLQPVVGICGPFMYTHRRTLIDKQLCCLRLRYEDSTPDARRVASSCSYLVISSDSLHFST